MTPLEAAGLYSGLNLIIMMVLAFRVSMVRRSSQIGIGDGNDETMLRTIRVHANGAEWVPGALIGLVLMALLESPLIAIHILGSLFTLGRIAHAIGYSQNPGVSLGRFVGSTLTYLTYLLIGLGLIGHAVL